MQRCAHCQFPLAHAAKTCGYCGVPIAHSLLAAVFERHGIHPRAPAPERTPAAHLGVPGAGERATALMDDPHAANATTVAEPPPAFTTVTLGDVWSPAGGPRSGALPYSSRPEWTPPPPVFAPTLEEHWWLAIPTAVPIVVWITARMSSYWSEALATDARICCAGGVALAAWLGYRRTLGALPSRWIAPAITALLLLMVAGVCAASTSSADLLQGHTAESNGDYTTALALFQRGNSPNDAARVQIEWGRTLAEQGAFAAAKGHIDAAIQQGRGITHDEARTALGHLYWLWGQARHAQHDLAGARTYWGDAVAAASGTLDGDRAAAALATHQTVTGQMTWLGGPLPGLKVALVSSWKYSAALGSLQTGGDRLEATTGADGSFDIGGAVPGTTYALIWVGTFGDTTRVDASGTPKYTVSILPLQGADIGKVSTGDTASTRRGTSAPGG